MGGDTSRLNDKEAAVLAVKLIKQLSDRVRLPYGFETLGVKEEDIDGWITKALNDPCLGCNPRETTAKDVKTIYSKVL